MPFGIVDWISRRILEPPNVTLPQRFSDYLQYWHALERSGSIPPLARLLDKANSQIHPWLNIVDIDSDTMQPIRFAGTHVADYFGKDLTRTNFLDILSPQARPIIVRSHREIAERPCGAYQESICSTLNGKEFKLFALGLPLLRSNDMPCVAWLLEPHDTVDYGEIRILVQRITRWNWVDLGHGMPT